MLDTKDKEQLKRIFAYAAINIFGLFILFELRSFISTFLGAIIFYVLFRSFMSKLVTKYNWNESLAAGFIILISFVSILIPITVLSYLMYSKISVVINDPSSLISLVNIIDKKIFEMFGVNIINTGNLDSIKLQAGNLISGFLGQIFWILGSIVIMYFILFFMLIKRERLTEEVNNYLPFNIENIQLFARDLELITLSNTIGVPIISVLQGTAAGFAYWFLGVNEPVFWGAITALVAFIPFAGTAIVWLPSSIFLVATNHVWQGIVLAIYCVAVVVNIDTILRFKILKKFANVHPMVTVFGVIIGLNLFGLPGLIFGPLMISYFIICVKLYKKIYKVEG